MIITLQQHSICVEGTLSTPQTKMAKTERMHIRKKTKELTLNQYPGRVETRRIGCYVLPSSCCPNCWRNTHIVAFVASAGPRFLNSKWLLPRGSASSTHRRSNVTCIRTPPGGKRTGTDSYVPRAINWIGLRLDAFQIVATHHNLF